MEAQVLLDVLARNVHHVRRLSLLNERRPDHEELESLREAFSSYGYIDRLEVCVAMYDLDTLNTLITINTNTLSDLKLKGDGRLNQPLLRFVESLDNIRSLELAQFEFTLADWKRVVTGKPYLRRLTVLDSGYKQEQSVFSKVHPRRPRLETEEPVDLGTLPITHLVLNDRRFFFELELATLRASPYLEQLELSLPAEPVAMIKEMPQAVQKLVLHLHQINKEAAEVIKEMKDHLTHLELNFPSRASRFVKRLEFVGILQECTNLCEFSYHGHMSDHTFMALMYKGKWNLPNLKTLRVHGVDQESPILRIGKPLPPCSVSGLETGSRGLLRRLLP
ncbi:hypothetical protein BGX29_008466 [Mortierella sp. GBA35]|nr:hypothetical protein BGX29_008466 [Mortierella sp. GBA35]